MFMPIIPPFASVIVGDLSFTFVGGSGVIASSTVPYPSGMQQNDLLFCVSYTRRESDIGQVIPAGFVEIGDGYKDESGGDTRFRATLSYKIATGSEGASFTSYSGTLAAHACLLVRPNRPIGSVIINSLSVQLGGANDVAPTDVVVPASPTGPSIYLHTYSFGTSISYGPSHASYSDYPDGVLLYPLTATVSPDPQHRRIPVMATGSSTVAGAPVLELSLLTAGQSYTCDYATGAQGRQVYFPMSCYLTFT